MTKILWVLTIATVVVSTYFARNIFYFKYDRAYYEHYYYHSQWYIPESTRTIPDEDLYKFVGYKLVEGENPFNLNYEVPPLGKFFYGMGEKLFGNPYLVSFAFYLLSIVLIYILARSIITTLIFTLNPMLYDQISQTMLDLPQLVFFLLHTIFLFRSNIIFAGLFLGLMAGTKIGIYIPLLIVLDLIFIKFWRQRLLLLMSIGGGYVLAYFSYFVRHPNPIPWLRLHKMVLKFYLDSGVNGNALNQFSTIIFNKYIAWWDADKIIHVSNWTILLPVGLGALILVLIKPSRTKMYYLGLCGAIFLVVNSLVPFWPRYLVMLLPIFALTITKIIKNKLLMRILILVSAIFFIRNLIPDPQTTLTSFTRYYQTNNYRDMYQLLSASDKRIMTEEKFEERLSKTNSLNTSVSVLNPAAQIDFTRENNVWRVVWDWNYVQEPVVESKSQIVVIPEQIQDWNKTLRALVEVNGETMNENWRRIKIFVPDKYPVGVSLISKVATKEDIQKLSQLPGVKITTRIEP